ncbi:MAG: hypothetical protein CM1200mP41_24060 [Gammaproteobacteria bacterium]|nr:MAG: hypothetical protein CM1200mP41_24060 [Gammaproteobacteria bacterium]
MGGLFKGFLDRAMGGRVGKPKIIMMSSRSGAPLERLEGLPTFTFEAVNRDRDFCREIFKKHQIHAVIHLAAQAGFPYSMGKTSGFFDANLVGFGNIWKRFGKRMESHWFTHLSRSVYGPMTSYPSQKGIVLINPCPCMRGLKDPTN